MGCRISYEKEAREDVEAIDDVIAVRILQKIKWYATQSNPLWFASRMKKRKIGTYKFRVGDWRVIFDYVDGTIIVLRIGHRSTIYK